MSVPEPEFLQFRDAVPADEAFLREMLYLAIWVPPGQPPLPRSVLDDPAIARYFEAWGSHPGDRGLVAMWNGVAIGAAWLRRFPATSPGYGFVDESIPELSIAVVPAYRGRGIGSRLMTELMRDTLRVPQLRSSQSSLESLPALWLSSSSRRPHDAESAMTLATDIDKQHARNRPAARRLLYRQKEDTASGAHRIDCAWHRSRRTCY